MLQTISSTRRAGSPRKRGIGLQQGPDPFEAVLAAAAMAREDLDGATPNLAIVVTTAPPRGDLTRALRSVFGPVGITGGVTAGLLTEQGFVTEGALVLCVSNAEGGASGVAATNGRRLSDAAQAAARLVLAGWPFRGRYPRGISVAFTGHGSGAASTGFLANWRELMGPKMRTVCGVMTTRTAVVCTPSTCPVASSWPRSGMPRGTRTGSANLPGAAPLPASPVQSSSSKRLTSNRLRYSNSSSEIDCVRRVPPATL